MSAPIILAYYLNLVASRGAPEVIHHTGIPEFCVCDFVSFFLSALVIGVFGISNELTVVEDTAACGVSLPLFHSIHNFV